MITEDYVSFKIAKLLKEKGFDELCIFKYDLEGTRVKAGVAIDEWQNGELDNGECSAPTLQMATKWLREVHNIFIDIYLPSHSEREDTIYHGTYSFDIFNLNTKVYVYCTWGEIEFNSYEEAVESALKYCLENLI